MMNSEAKYYSRTFKCFQNSGFLSETLGHVEGRKQDGISISKRTYQRPRVPAQTYAIHIINSSERPPGSRCCSASDILPVTMAERV